VATTSSELAMTSSEGSTREFQEMGSFAVVSDAYIQEHSPHATGRDLQGCVVRLMWGWADGPGVRVLLGKPRLVLVQFTQRQGIVEASDSTLQK